MRKLLHCDLHVRPEEFDRLTMTELDLYLDQDMKPRPSDGSAAACMGPEEIAAEIERRRSMTLADRLREAREG